MTATSWPPGSRSARSATSATPRAATCTSRSTRTAARSTRTASTRPPGSRVMWAAGSGSVRSSRLGRCRGRVRRGDVQHPGAQPHHRRWASTRRWRPGPQRTVGLVRCWPPSGSTWLVCRSSSSRSTAPSLASPATPTTRGTRPGTPRTAIVWRRDRWRFVSARSFRSHTSTVIVGGCRSCGWPISPPAGLGVRRTSTTRLTPAGSRTKGNGGVRRLLPKLRVVRAETAARASRGRHRRLQRPPCAVVRPGRPCPPGLNVRRRGQNRMSPTTRGRD